MIHYLNTDLDLECQNDLSELARHFESHGIFSLHVEQVDSGSWSSRHETEQEYAEPETNIVAMLDAINSLDEPSLKFWRECKLREFNIGYECGREPWAFNHGLSNDTLQRIAKAGASLRITLYHPTQLRSRTLPNKRS